jgi:hypothetical protein
VDRVFSIFSPPVGSFSQNFNFEQIVWIAWLYSATVLKSCRRRLFHSWLAEGQNEFLLLFIPFFKGFP